MAKKLSTAQVALLKDLKGTCINTYKPMLALDAAGLVTTEDTSYGRKNWKITAEGEKYLAELPK